MFVCELLIHLLETIAGLSVSAHFEFRVRKKHLSTAIYRRVITVTVSPATFKSKRWCQAQLMLTRCLKIDVRFAHLTRLNEINEVKAHLYAP